MAYRSQGLDPHSRPDALAGLACGAPWQDTDSGKCPGCHGQKASSAPTGCSSWLWVGTSSHSWLLVAGSTPYLFNECTVPYSHWGLRLANGLRWSLHPWCKSWAAYHRAQCRIFHCDGSVRHLARPSVWTLFWMHSCNCYRHAQQTVWDALYATHNPSVPCTGRWALCLATDKGRSGIAHWPWHRGHSYFG